MDGQTKVVNRILMIMLICIIRRTTTSWEDHLSLIEFAYNCSFHSFVGKYPFEACYGFNPLFSLTMTISSHVFVSLVSKKRDQEIMNIHSKVKEVIDKYNSKMANQKNHGRKQVIFKYG